MKVNPKEFNDNGNWSIVCWLQSSSILKSRYFNFVGNNLISLELNLSNITKERRFGK